MLPLDEDEELAGALGAGVRAAGSLRATGADRGSSRRVTVGCSTRRRAGGAVLVSLTGATETAGGAGVGTSGVMTPSDSVTALAAVVGASDTPAAGTLIDSAAGVAV
jgi:hypothetical protein